MDALLWQEEVDAMKSLCKVAHEFTHTHTQTHLRVYDDDDDDSTKCAV